MVQSLGFISITDNNLGNLDHFIQHGGLQGDLLVKIRTAIDLNSAIPDPAKVLDI